MQNKANFRKSQMNVNTAITKDYENIANWTLGENKPNSKPIKANQTQNKPKTKPKQTQTNPISKGIPILLCGALSCAASLTGLRRTGPNDEFN